ncbi:MAG TPA: hypothetical protein VEL11_11510 [Candidatus Bathyarchaeia archaeon]|nr:hypothetical protein [Candidatus Bathyarchaeia archaeon]
MLLVLYFGYSFDSPVYAKTPSTSANNNVVKYLPLSFRQVVASAPEITNISSKGIYKVKLGWNSPISVQSLPKGGFSMYIQFTNATSPPGTASLASVKSFDMTIYDSHGRVLWSRVNQVPFAGGWWSFEEVVFPQVYNGNITISIHNIKSLLHGVPTDSVDFAAKVV